MKEKLQNEVTKIKEKLENILLKCNQTIKICERIYKGIKNLENEKEKNMIKTLSYVSKINKNDKEINFLLKQQIKSKNIKFDKEKNDIEFENYKNSKDFKSFQCKKTLKSHTGLVNHIANLQDGRIASCSKDKKIIIYDNQNFDPQIEINNIHSKQIFSFTQLEDGKIVTCSEDKTMKLIQLDEDKYSIVQSLEQHQGYVVKIIEFKIKKFIIYFYP